MPRYFYSVTLLMCYAVAIDANGNEKEQDTLRHLRGNAVDCSMVLCANPCDGHVCNMGSVCKVTATNGNGQCCGRAKCFKVEDAPEPVQCGKNTCESGQVCCNESCGICTNPDDGCIHMWCDP